MACSESCLAVRGENFLTMLYIKRGGGIESNHCRNTEFDIKSMLHSIGVKSIDELFQSIPEDLRTKSFNLPEGKSEFEVFINLKALSEKNKNFLNFIGGGKYDHFIPAAVDALAARAEFYTAYTPYQPECSQGTLQALFEYQTAICNLTGMDVSNASLYDGEQPWRKPL